MLEIDKSIIHLQPQPAPQPNRGRDIFPPARRRSGFGRSGARCDNSRVGRTDRLGGDNLCHGARPQGQIVEEVRFAPEREKGYMSRHSRQVFVYATGADRGAGTKGRQIFAAVSAWPSIPATSRNVGTDRRDRKHHRCATIPLCVTIAVMELRNVINPRHHHHGRHPMRRGSLRP